MFHANCFKYIVAVVGLTLGSPAFAGITSTTIFGGSITDLDSPGIGSPGPTQTITLTFGGGSPGYGAQLTALSLAGANASDFAIVGGTCQPNTTILQSAPPGPGSCTVIVQYTASSANPANAELNGSCSTVALGVGGYSISCDTAMGQLAALTGTLLAALVATPMLDPRTLTALCLLMLLVGVYFASRKRA